jgi:hypothetical protein
MISFLKKIIIKISLPVFSLYFTGFLPLKIQLEAAISFAKIIDFFRKILFFKSIFSLAAPKKNRESSILDFWRAVEYFSVKNIPEISPPPKEGARPVEQVFDYSQTELLPWEPNHWMFQSPKEEGKFLRFKVFGGVCPDRLIRQTLEDKCGKDDNYEDDLGASEKLNEGNTCAYFFNVTDDGRPLFDSFFLPTCVWALGRTLNPGPKDPTWFNDFNDFEMQIKQDFREHFAIEDDDVIGQGLKQFNVGRIIKTNHLMAYTQKVIGHLGLESLLLDGPLKEPKIRLQSFYGTILPKAPEKGRYEVYETEFLNSFFIDDLSKISKIMNTRDGLQQCGFGLKRFLSPEKDIETKKRVDVRNDKKQVLSSLEPSKFPSGCWPTKGHHPLATSQQFAINEIRNLTHKAGILAVNGPPGTGKTTLLRDLISSIVVERAKSLSFLKKPSDAFEGTGSWKVNDYHRTISLWKPEFNGFEVVVASSNNGAIENVTLEIPGRTAVDPSWLPEIDYFTDLASFLLNQPAWALVGARLGSKKNCNDFCSAFWYGKSPKDKNASSSQNVSTAHKNQEVIVSFGKINPSSDQKRGLQDLLKSFISQSINWEESIVEFNKALDFEKEKRAEAEKIYALFQEAVQLQEKPKWIPRFLGEWGPLAHLLTYLLPYKRKKLDALQKQLSQKIDGISLVAWLEDETIRELSVPWLTPEWFQARAQVFIEALKLHKSFIIANAKTMENNLRGAMDVLQETVPLDTDPKAIFSAWSSLFFVVPVISTTFASFSRLFSHMGEEGLGWLLIDEAGQALPQAAVGSIGRAKRTVVVGDPMKLKPVISLSLAAQTTLQRHFKTETTWIPGRTSTQELADRVCSMGTMIKQGNQHKWVGMPLRVHRRCEKLEFDLSNKISYGNLMIFGTPNRPALALPESQWLNIPETNNHGHWIPEEGNITKRLVLKLMQEGTPPQSIFVISPFRVVVDGLTIVLRNINKRLNIGTIHTTQGKEADVVILVLGGNPEKPGAKKWASQEPNLLNVAVTRAKRRFYIIGNQGEWSKYPYFCDASALLAMSPSSYKEGQTYQQELMRFFNNQSPKELFLP